MGEKKIMKAGFARLDITPPLGIQISGYFEARLADGILDPLQVHAVAVSDGTNIASVVSLDNIGIRQLEMDIIRHRAAECNAIPYEAVFIACTHTHTGPEVSSGCLLPCDDAYNEYLFRRISDAIGLAIEDMKEATVEIARGEAKGIAFVRRFLMKNGSIYTNPGVNNLNIEHPMGTPDETVQLMKIVRKDAADIAIVNFQVHPDVIGGKKYSSDFPGFVRRTLEGSLQGEKDGKGVHVVYFNGAQGDTNHINVKGSTTIGYAHSEHMGRVIAGAVMAIYSQTMPVEDGPVVYGQKVIKVPANKGTEQEVDEAKELWKLYNENREEYGRRVNVPMKFGEIYRLIEMEHASDIHELYLTAVGFGGIVFAGLPGEPFTEIGRSIKAQSPFTMTIPCCCANGYQGYLPMSDCFEEGGYEATSSRFKAGVGEALIETSVALIKELSTLKIEIEKIPK